MDLDNDFFSPSGSASSKSELIIVILSGIGIMVITWVFLYTFAPEFVKCSCTDTYGEPGEVDPTRCLAYSLVFVIILGLFVWLFRSCTSKLKK